MKGRTELCLNLTFLKQLIVFNEIEYSITGSKYFIKYFPRPKFQLSFKLVWTEVKNEE